MGMHLREEDRSCFRLPESDLRRGDEYILICAWCREKVKVENDWLELGEAMRNLEFFAASLSPRLSHGLCSSCRDEVKKGLEEFKAGLS